MSFWLVLSLLLVVAALAVLVVATRTNLPKEIAMKVWGCFSVLAVVCFFLLAPGSAVACPPAQPVRSLAHLHCAERMVVARQPQVTYRALVVPQIQYLAVPQPTAPLVLRQEAVVDSYSTQAFVLQRGHLTKVRQQRVGQQRLLLRRSSVRTKTVTRG